METKNIPLSEIDTTGFNARVAMENQEEYKGEIEALAKNIADVGLLSPILVCQKEDKKGYILVAGFRRYAASMVNAAAGKTPATVLTHIYPYLPESQRILLNMTENLARKDISTFETARGCVALVDSGLKGEEIAERLAFSSRAHVNNLIRAFRNLIEPIKKAWARGVGFCTTTWLFSVSALKPDDQTLEYDKQVGSQKGEKGEGDSGEGKEGEEKGEKPEKEKLPKVRKGIEIDRAFSEALKVINSLKISNPLVAKTITALHAFVKGESDSFAGIDLAAEKNAKELEKAKEKAAKDQLAAQEKLKALKERQAELEAIAAGNPLPKKPKAEKAEKKDDKPAKKEKGGK